MKLPLILRLNVLAYAVLLADGIYAQDDAATPAKTPIDVRNSDNQPVAAASQANGKEATPAKAKRPLYERDPFDIVHLDASNQNTELMVEPLDFPNRQAPDPPPVSGALNVRFVDQPTDVFEVAWRHIVKIELFESLILKEAHRLSRKATHLTNAEKYVEARQVFDEAYWYFEYLASHAPETPQLDESIENYLMKNAVASYRTGDYADAFSILSELQRRNPNHKGLAVLQRRITDSLFMEHVKGRDYWKARELLGHWKNSPDPRWKQLVESRFSQLEKLARRHLSQAQKYFSEQRYRDAKLAVGRALEVLPDVREGAELSQQLAKQYPVVTVGVKQLAQPDSVPSLANWSANRRARLLGRNLVEFNGPSSEGGEYLCPWGTLRQSDDGTTLHLKLRPSRSGGPHSVALSSYDVTRQLLDMADRTHPDYRVTWAVILKNLNLKDVFKLDVQLQHTFVKPDALLQLKLFDAADGTSKSLAGPFRLGPSAEGESVYLSQPDFALSSTTQMRQIVERQVNDGKVGQMLRLGQIDVVDRVNPVHVARLQNQPGIVVERYDVPTIHVLVPNVEDNSLLANTLFRKALAYGLHRELILKQMILGGTNLEGCQVLSGPFPAGFTSNDPLGYAYHSQTDPLNYHPVMARILSAVAVNRTFDHAEKVGQVLPQAKPLILAYPNTDAATIASPVMVEQLKSLEVPFELKPLPPGVVQPDDGYDLLYMEWTITEPVVDAGRLFGDGGLVRSSSTYLKHTVRQLDHVTNWVEARELLNKIHQIVHQEVTVIPLWQLAEHLAYHRRLRGIESQPVHLYQNVEQWRIAPEVVDEGT